LHYDIVFFVVPDFDVCALFVAVVLSKLI